MTVIRTTEEAEGVIEEIFKRVNLTLDDLCLAVLYDSDRYY